MGYEPSGTRPNSPRGAEALLGLDGFRILEVAETPAEVVVGVETTVDLVGCTGRGVRAEVHARLRVDIRDLPCFGRPARLVWMKRRWRCIARAQPTFVTAGIVPEATLRGRHSLTNGYP
jgi:hypothetical protein